MVLITAEGSWGEGESYQARRKMRARARARKKNSGETLTRYDELNSGQKRIFDTIMRAVRQKKLYNEDQRLARNRKLYFLPGTAGTGKTHLLPLLRDVAEKDGTYVLISSTTSIAAAMGTLSTVYWGWAATTIRMEVLRPKGRVCPSMVQGLKEKNCYEKNFSWFYRWSIHDGEATL